MPIFCAPAPVSARLRSSAVVAAFVAVSVTLAASVAHAAAVTVREPAFGLPHIFADTDLELARENGREIAKDRLGQMILIGRVARGTLSQAFGLLDPGAIDDDIETRQLGYTSSELNRMFEALPAEERDLILEYCKGVNDTIEAIYAGGLPQPIELSLLRSAILNLGDDLFGNKTNISDQVDPFFAPPGGEWPTAGFQFTPEIAISIGVLQVRNFGLGGFSEDLFSELQALMAQHGDAAGAAIWDDRRFINDPLAPVSVPDATTPGFGGPLAAVRPKSSLLLAERFPAYDYAKFVTLRAERSAARAERASRLGAWPKLGSYAWAIGPGKSATGKPWIGGFPQTGELTPSIMHYVENRSAEAGGVRGNGMEFVGAPLVLIGHTDQVAWTTTTAQLPVLDTVFEEIFLTDSNVILYVDEGSLAPLSQRTELFRGTGQSLVFWRSKARSGNGGSRPVLDFLGDAQGTATSGSETQLVASGAGFDGSLVGGHVAIVGGAGIGQVRTISAVPDADTLAVGIEFTPPPAAGSSFVAVGPAGKLIAVAIDSSAWMEETTAVLGFSKYQRATSIEDIREGVRLIPTTHNFFAADNLAWNEIGTDPGLPGNIGFWSSGFSRVRQDGGDLRLPIDGASPDNPLVAIGGTLDAATATTLTSAGAFAGQALAPPPRNARYDDPLTVPSEYVVSIVSGAGYKQTRRIASNDNDTLTVESPFGMVPAAGDRFEVQEIIAMPEAMNPSEGFTANWNNKAATADPGDGFGRNHRVAFILERLATENQWDRAKQRQLNADVAGLDGRGRFGRYLIPRLRAAVDEVGNGGTPEVDTVLARLEQWNGTPEFGRNFVDPVADTMFAGEVAFLKDVFTAIGNAIYADEFGALGVLGGSRGEALVIHAIDAAAGDVTGARPQSFTGDYFNGADWKVVVRDAFATVAAGGIPADSARPNRSFDHPLSALFPELKFPEIPLGNRGTYEQIVEVAETVRGEFIFPLGQSAHIQGTIASVAFIDPNVTTLHPVWRDWRFVPMLSVSQDLPTAPTGDSDGDGIFDGFKRWYFDTTEIGAGSDDDGDHFDLLAEFEAGTDPTNPDTDGDGVLDGLDEAPQDRLVVPEPAALLQGLVAAAALGALARRRGRG